MSLHPKIQLSRIRQIGWRYWDPIDLHDGSEFGPTNCADEYDRYLLHVVDVLCQGGTRADSTSYLVQIASEHMGLGGAVGLDAPRKTVDAIAEYLRALPDASIIED